MNMIRTIHAVEVEIARTCILTVFVVCKRNAFATVSVLAQHRAVQEVLAKAPLEVPMEESIPLAPPPAVQVAISTRPVEHDTLRGPRCVVVSPLLRISRVKVGPSPHDQQDAVDLLVPFRTLLLVLLC